MANVNVQALLKTTTGLSTAQIQNYFLDTNTPSEQMLASANVVISAETLLQNGATGTSVFCPLWDNNTGMQFVPTRLYFQQVYLPAQSATAGAAGVFAGTAAATAALNVGLAVQKTPVTVPTLLVPGTSQSFTSQNWIVSGPVNVFQAANAFTSIVTAASTSGTFVYGNQQTQFIAQANLGQASAVPNSVLPNNTLYLAVNTSGTTSANLTVTASFKVFVEGLLQPL